MLDLNKNSTKRSREEATLDFIKAISVLERESEPTVSTRNCQGDHYLNSRMSGVKDSPLQPSYPSTGQSGEAIHEMERRTLQPDSPSLWKFREAKRKRLFHPSSRQHKSINWRQTRRQFRLSLYWSLALSKVSFGLSRWRFCSIIPHTLMDQRRYLRQNRKHNHIWQYFIIS